MSHTVQLLSDAAEDQPKLLSDAACACEHEMHFHSFSNCQHLERPHARKQQLAATGNRPLMKGWVAMMGRKG